MGGRDRPAGDDMGHMRKFIPFALAAGIAGGVAQAQDDVTYERFPADAFGCTQVVYKFASGTYRHIAECPNMAGSVLIARQALARMDWARAHAENSRLLAAGIGERDVIEGLTQSALMRGDRDEAVRAASSAALAGVVTPHGALINAVRAAQAGDKAGILDELLQVLERRSSAEPAAVYINQTAYAIEGALRGGAPGDAAALLARALAEAEEGIREDVKNIRAREGARAAERYAAYADAATMMRHAAEILLDPGNDDARRRLAAFYIHRDAHEAARDILDAIPPERRTQEDRGLRRMAVYGQPMPPIPAPAPR